MSPLIDTVLKKKVNFLFILFIIAFIYLLSVMLFVSHFFGGWGGGVF